MGHTTRLAPSPTGALHLGNARTFLINWLCARQSGWKVTLRVDDLDGPRTKPGADQAAIDDLQWLGIDWDSGPTRQSTRTSVYAAAVEMLLRDGFAYYCNCTRKEVESAASAPHADDGAAVYPGTCRGLYRTRADAIAASGRVPAVRFAVRDGRFDFTDNFAGPRSFQLARQLGDFVIQKSDGTAAYQLAVVVDDAEAGVTQVIRGDDLIESTPRQILLYRALNLAQQIPAYTHLPLIVGEDGKRLAKRHGDTRLGEYRKRGVPAERVLALLAKWCGVRSAGKDLESASMQKLLADFRLDRVPRAPITFTRHDDAFLRGYRS